MRLALSSGIPPSVWAGEGERAIATAFELLEEAHRASETTEDDGRQLAG